MSSHANRYPTFRWLLLLAGGVLCVLTAIYNFALAAEVAELEVQVRNTDEKLFSNSLDIKLQEDLAHKYKFGLLFYKISDALRIIRKSHNRDDFPVRSGDVIAVRMTGPTGAATEYVKTTNVSTTFYLPKGKHRLKLATHSYLPGWRSANRIIIDNEREEFARHWKDRPVDVSLEGDAVYDFAIRVQRSNKDNEGDRVVCFLDDEPIATLISPDERSKSTLNIKGGAHQRYPMLRRPNELNSPRVSLPMCTILAGHFEADQLFVYFLWLESDAKPGMDLQRIVQNKYYFNKVYDRPISEVFEDPDATGYYFFRPGILEMPESDLGR